MNKNCSCGDGIRLIVGCSGCADVGEIADKTVRLLSGVNIAKMTCLAGIGAHISGFVASAKGACQFITVDGCSVACARTMAEHIGVKPKAFVLTDMGFIKGKTQVNEDNVSKAAEVIKKELCS